MRKTFGSGSIALFFIFFSVITTYAQCNAVPAIEAVRNGDFEAGYITKSGSGHSYTVNGPFDFQSDLTSAVDYNTTTPNCVYGMAKQYGVARNEAANLAPCGSTNPYLGSGYINVPFTDHTPGKGGNGFAFIGDFELTPVPVSSYGGTWPALWRQHVTLQAGQPYYFSAWFANYNFNAASGSYNTPNLKFVVIPMVSGVLQTAQRFPMGDASPTGQMVWQQFYGTWNSGIYTEAMIYIEVEQAADMNTNDIVLDDISFINGCQNLSAFPQTPNLGASQSICLSNGTITLNSNTTPATGTKYYWYNGTTPIGTPGSNTQNTMNISAAGTYRVCVENTTFTPATCAASSTVVITNTMPSVTVADQTICASTSVTLTASISSPYLTYAWTVPSGVTNPGNVQSFSTSTAGNYSVSVASTSGIGSCTPSTDNATVTSNLASANVNSVVTCTGASKTFNVTASGGSGSSYAWYTTPTGGSPIATGATTNVTVSSSPFTAYVENFSTTTIKNDKASYTTTSDGGDYANRSYISFTANTSFVLSSVEVLPDFCGGNVVISLWQSGSQVGSNVSVPCGAAGTWQTVNLNYDIPAGGGYQLRIGGGSWFRINSGSSSNTTTSLATISSNAYGWGPFSNWVTKAASCIRTPVSLDCALPVNYLYFEAVANKNQDVDLDWATSSEINNDHFEIERSVNGDEFSLIAVVPGQNTSNTLHNYVYIDFNAPKGQLYYRLRQVDINGTYTFSAIKAVTLNETSIHIQPNPNNGIFNITLNGNIEDYSLQITDALGKTILSKTGSGSGLTVDLSAFPKGVYIVGIHNDELNFFDRVVVE